MVSNVLNTKIINLTNIEYNLYEIKNFINRKKILLPVKADAYGHGIEEVVKYFKNSELVDYFGVATIEEATIIRKLNIDKPIVLLGTPTDYDLEKCVALQVSPTISTIDNHRYYNTLVSMYRGHLPPVHVKIDTGMHRNGLYPEEFEEILPEIKYRIEGIYTHFATADEYEMSYFLKQKSTFFNLLSSLKKKLPDIIVHCANSSALLKDDSTFLDMVRPGLISYGYYPSEDLKDTIKIKPSLKLYSTIVGLKRIKKGDSVSYGATWTADKDSLIAILPIGYGDGIFRNLSNKAKVIVHDELVDVVGTICMDQLLIDVSNVSDVKVGDKVVIIDGELSEEISVEKVAQLANTIPYEITTHLKNNRLFVKYQK